MILIIADDLSGAAELAGIAASRGFRTEVHLQCTLHSSAEVVAIDSNTRALPPAAAAARVASIHEQAQRLKPDWIYKKTDSVLRGNIRAELEILRERTGAPCVLFIPANPGKERCIRNGRYFVRGQPLDETVFASDPDHPRQTADVVQLLQCEGLEPVHSIRARDPLAESGIVIPDVSSSDDLARRASEVSDQVLAAGAAEFFEALLSRDARNRRAPPAPPVMGPMPGPALFICGSLAAWEQGIQQQAEQSGMTVFLPQPRAKWVEKTIAALRTSGRAMMAVGPAQDAKPKPTCVSRSERFLQPLTEAASAVLHQCAVRQVFVEGGSTATALMQRMGWIRFASAPSEMTGVGLLRPLDSARGTVRGHTPNLLVKPGSYPWPDPAWSAGNRSRSTLT